MDIKRINQFFPFDKDDKPKKQVKQVKKKEPHGKTPYGLDNFMNDRFK